MARDYKLTTFDNPYDPFDDFAKWYMYDVDNGYNSCERLAMEANISDDMTRKEEQEETNRAIDAIIFADPLNIYKKVYKDTEIDAEKAS